MAKISVGSAAPAFSLPDEKGGTVRLVDALAAGPVVLIFYPMDNTPGCTAQLCAVRDDAARYTAAGISVFGINNGSASSHERFAQRHHLTAPLLVDKNLEVAAQYDAALNLGLVKIVNRTVVGIGRDGAIAFYKRGTPSTDEIVAALGTASVR